MVRYGAISIVNESGMEERVARCARMGRTPCCTNDSVTGRHLTARTITSLDVDAFAKVGKQLLEAMEQDIG